MSKEAKETIAKFTEWMPIDENNLPSDRLICQWKHPEYGIITGSLVRYGGKLESEKAWWVFPEGGSEADIWLGEFTAYRKYLPKPKPTPPQPVDTSLNEAAETLEDAAIRIIQKLRGQPFHSEIECFKFGANYERAKLPEIIKEVLRRAADEVKNECTLYDNGGDNIDEEVREHILSTNCDDLIK